MLKRFSLVLLAVLAMGLGGQASQTLRVTPLPRGEELLVSFQLEQELTPDLRQKIHSGLQVRFVYKVDLKRNSSIWLDRTMATAEVTATIRFDNLRRRYDLSRMTDGKDLKVSSTDSEEVAWSWVTSQFERMQLFRGVRLDSNAEYYVRVRVHTAPQTAAFVWPWQGDDVVGFAKFTFIR